MAFAVVDLHLSEKQFWTMHQTAWIAAATRWNIQHGHIEDPARAKAENAAAHQGLLALIRHAKQTPKGSRP